MTLKKEAIQNLSPSLHGQDPVGMGEYISIMKMIIGIITTITTTTIITPNAKEIIKETKIRIDAAMGGAADIKAAADTINFLRKETNEKSAHFFDSVNGWKLPFSDDSSRG